MVNNDRHVADDQFMEFLILQKRLGLSHKHIKQVIKQNLLKFIYLKKIIDVETWF